MSTTLFKLPDLGEGLQEVQIISWHVSEGDFVVNEQPLLSVETEKAVVDIPSPQSGKISKLYGQVGQTMTIGTVLVEFSNDNGSSSGDSGSVVGNLDALTDEPSELKEIPTASSFTFSSSHTPEIKAIPAARKLAQEKGIALSTLQGSGPQGTITVQDVQQALHENPLSSSKSDDLNGYQPLSGIRKSMAQHMAYAHAEVVPATLHDEVDIQNWIGTQSIMIRVIQALVAACKAEPILNSWFEKNNLKKNATVNLGIAVDTPEGLLVPVIRNVDTLEEDQIKVELERLKLAAYNRTLAPSDFKEATLTLSNFGAISGRHGVMVVTPPQVAILGTGRVIERVISTQGVLEVHKFLPLSLTIDHRVITGGEAARFLAKIIGSLKE